MQRRTATFSSGLLLLFSLWCSRACADDAHTIVQNGRAFHPGEITITHGESLSFSNQDEFIHQIYVDVDGFGYDSEEQPPGETFTIHFPNAGTFPVRCHIHPKMLLTVHVK
jgi:plastocyanin